MQMVQEMHSRLEIVPEGDTVSWLGALSGERPVLWRLAIVAGAWRLLQCCELWNVITKRL